MIMRSNSGPPADKGETYATRLNDHYRKGVFKKFNITYLVKPLVIIYEVRISIMIYLGMIKHLDSLQPNEAF